MLKILGVSLKMDYNRIMSCRFPPPFSRSRIFFSVVEGGIDMWHILLGRWGIDIVCDWVNGN